MAKIARTPFNASRMITGKIGADKTLVKNSTGYTYFLTTSDAEINVNVSYTSKGAYYKFILKETSTQAIKISTSAMVGLMVSDAGGTVTVEESAAGDTTLVIPSGCAAGTYVDLVCDGTTWYARGMSAGGTAFSFEQ